MKNIVSFNNNVKCNSCDENGFFCYTPSAADYNTCPICSNYDFVRGGYMFGNALYIKYFGDDIDLDKVYENYNFCGSCRILFSVGCIHACNGCTNDCYNGHLVSKWKYKGEEYTGMPQFDSIDEWYSEIKNIEILEWKCPNDGLHCTKGSYPKVKYPQYYGYCKLNKNKNN